MSNQNDINNRATIIGCLNNLAVSDNTDVLSTNFMANMIPYPRLECFDVIDGQFITAFDKRNPEMLLLKPIKTLDIKDWVLPKLINHSFYLVLDRFTTSKGNKRHYITKKWAESLREVKFPKVDHRGCFVGLNAVNPTMIFTVTRWDPEKMVLDASNNLGTYMNISNSKWVSFPEPLQND